MKTRKYGNDTTTVLTLEFIYDLRGLLSSKSVTWATTPSWTDYDKYKTTSESFAFDGVYRLTDADDDDTQVTFAYNDLDQLTSEKLKIKKGDGTWHAEKTTSYKWDKTGKRREEVTYPISGKKFEYLHDALDRVTQIELYVDGGMGDKPMAEYLYMGPGQRVIERQRGVDLGDTSENTTFFPTYYEYDPLARLTEIEHVKATHQDMGDPTEEVLRKFAYGYTDSQRHYLISDFDIYDSGATALTRHDLSYDDLNRLVEDKRSIQGAAWEDFDYTVSDAQFYQKRTKDSTEETSFAKATDGSLQATSYTVNATTTTNLTYDVRGNLTDEGTATDYRYDHRHQDNSNK